MSELPPEIQALQNLHQHPIIRDYLRYVDGCAKYDAPPSVTKVFLELHAHQWTEPKPEFTQIWGETSPNWRWQKRHSDAMSSVESAVSAAYYHGEHLAQMEHLILAYPQREAAMKILGNATIGGGNTRKLDFEYQAFIFAYRRALDYLALAIAALLKQEFHSFRELPKSLERHADVPWVQTLVAMHGKHSPKLGNFMNTGDKLSTRDRIAHYEAVPAGCLNCTPRGIFLAGGGANLDGQGALTAVLRAYLVTLEVILREAVDAIKMGMPKAQP